MVDPSHDVAEPADSRDREPSIALSRAQRKALAQLCRLHESGPNPRRFHRRSLLLAVYIALVLGFSVLLLNLTAFAPPAYLFLGFVLGGLLKDLRILAIFRGIWPVYEAVIDWPRAFHLLKKTTATTGYHAGDRDLS